MNLSEGHDFLAARPFPMSILGFFLLLPFYLSTPILCRIFFLAPEMAGSLETSLHLPLTSPQMSTVLTYQMI